jgi:hypothetical protein
VEGAVVIPFDRASSNPHPAIVVGTTPAAPVDQVEHPNVADSPRISSR